MVKQYSLLNGKIKDDSIIKLLDEMNETTCYSNFVLRIYEISKRLRQTHNLIYTPNDAIFEGEF